ncbi:MAG: hypothetical protein M2R45_04390 [Verrucomicrobia subdivision 3 bacterium]|nr:hypothetical protein [Limisphaerales bacterium]MCS1417271.1 hypothetical protein [Limisphaerales bacterium]
MSGHTPEEIYQERKRYLLVFLILAIGTVVTVLVSFIEFELFAWTVALALAVATVKGFFVAGYFMHLTDEKKTIYLVMVATVFFFISLMFLTIWAMSDAPANTIYP